MRVLPVFKIYYIEKKKIENLAKWTYHPGVWLSRRKMASGIECAWLECASWSEKKVFFFSCLFCGVESLIWQNGESPRCFSRRKFFFRKFFFSFSRPKMAWKIECAWRELRQRTFCRWKIEKLKKIFFFQFLRRKDAIHAFWVIPTGTCMSIVPHWGETFIIYIVCFLSCTRYAYCPI